MVVLLDVELDCPTPCGIPIAWRWGMSLRIRVMSDCEPAALPAAKGCRVIEVNDVVELAGYRLAWDALLAQSPHSNYFQTLDWLSTYWRHNGADARLRVLVVQVHGKTIGFLPLVERKQASRVGTIRSLTYPLHDWGSFYGPIGPNVTATLLAGLGHIRRTPRNWDVLDLRWIDEQTADRGRTRQALAAKGFFSNESVYRQTALIDLASNGTWQNYWASRTTKWRTNVRRNERRLAELGAVEHVRYRPLGAARGDGDPRWDLYEQCEQIAVQSWQGDSTTGTTLSHVAIRKQLREQHETAARAGGVDVNLLYVDRQPVAFNYCYHYRGQVYGLRMGFDRADHAEGAGTVLLYRMIQDSFARGDRLFDLGADYLACKRNWLTHTAIVGRQIHYPPGISRAQLLRAKRWLEAVGTKFKERGARQSLEA
jgi:CelD/BcsL family acetyltransferase involved in cellulose biosynthesis